MKKEKADRAVVVLLFCGIFFMMLPLFGEPPWRQQGSFFAGIISVLGAVVIGQLRK